MKHLDKASFGLLFLIVTSLFACSLGLFMATMAIKDLFHVLMALSGMFG